jgi:hypothetical protein
MSPTSIASYAQVAKTTPPRREEAQSVADRHAEDEKSIREKSQAGAGRGRKIDINT